MGGADAAAREGVFVLTERSDPIEDSAPKVVPPTPPVGAPASPVIGAARSEPKEVRVTRSECAVAVRNEGFRLLSGLFYYQQQRSSHVQVRRLLVAPLPTANDADNGGMARKRKDRAGGTGGGAGPGGRAREGGGSVTCCGATFGATMGNIVGYLERHNQRKGERAHLLRAVGAQLTAADRALQTMWGEDANYLGRGTGIYRVVLAQRSELPELSSLRRIRDGPGGRHPGAAVGTTASLIALFACMCEVGAQCAHIASDESFIKAMRCAEAALMAWSTPSLCLRSSHWRSLEAERRALERAIDGAREAALRAVELGSTPEQKMALQLAWARQAAYPQNSCVDLSTQEALRARARDRSLFDVEVAPLSEVHLPATLAADSEDDWDDGTSRTSRTSRTTSSSWQTVGSAPSPAVSIASQSSAASADSLERELAGPLARSMVLSVT